MIVTAEVTLPGVLNLGAFSSGNLAKQRKMSFLWEITVTDIHEPV